MNKLISAVAVSFCLVSAANAKDIVDTAVSAGSFNTLAAALQAADLVDTLKGEWPVHGVCADRRSLCKDSQGRS